jgi:hypothetical protein
MQKTAPRPFRSILRGLPLPYEEFVARNPARQAGRAIARPRPLQLSVRNTYFHSQTLLCVFPSASISYSNTPGAAFNFAIFDDVV